MGAEKPLVARRLGVFFEPLRDRRRRRARVEFPLVDLVVMAVVAVIGGANDWDGIAMFAQGHGDWFREHLNPELARMPSVSTFRDVLTCFKAQELLPCFEAFARSFAAEHGDADAGLKHQALDGKALRGSWKHGLGPLKLLHAWTATGGLLSTFSILRQGSEVPALMEMLRRLELKGTVTSIDAAGAVKKIARTIVKAEGDYFVSVKANQRNLYEDIAERMFKVSQGHDDPDVRSVQKVECHHGRVEERTLWIAPASQVPSALGWPGAKTVGLQRRIVTVQGKHSVGWRYFLSSLPPEDLAGHRTVLRSHWTIENKLHWTLDVAFREDHSTLRDERSQVFFAVLRRLALAVMSKAPPARPTRKTSLQGSRLFAGWNSAYLEKVIASVFAGR